MSRSHRHMHRRRNSPEGIDGIVRKNRRTDSNGDGYDRGSFRRSGEGDHGQKNGNDSHEERVQTVVQIVYQTMPATFDGPIAGYSTLSQQDQPLPTNAPKPEATPTPSHGTRASSKSPEAGASMPTVIRPPVGSQSVDSVLAQATGSPSPSPSPASSHALPPTVAVEYDGQFSTPGPSSMLAGRPTATVSASRVHSDAGASAGEKAGIAFGVIGGVFIVGLIAYLIFRRRRQAHCQQLDDDEKSPGMMRAGAGAGTGAGTGLGGPSTALPRSNPGAPRISLRPVTQFLPNWSLEKRTSKSPDTALNLGIAISTDHADRPDTNQSTRSANPFGNHAERAPSPIREEEEGSSSSSSVSRNPASPSPRELTSERCLARPSRANDEDVVDRGDAAGSESNAGVSVTATAAATEAAGDGGTPSSASPSSITSPGITQSGAVGSTMMRKASMRHRNPHQVDLTTSPATEETPTSPAGTEFSISSTAEGNVSSLPSESAAAIAAAGGPANSTVHRVQLSFKPTLDDELEVRSGELIRLLHEYDDGWALVIRLDRSRQGVVPRTCLSTRPVKPRPPHARPPVRPSGYARRPSSPRSQRPMTPQGMHSNNGRASPARPRMGPGVLPRLASPAGQPMDQPMKSVRKPAVDQVVSPSESNAPNPVPLPPAGPQVGSIDRKPVPGQAY